MLTGNVYSLTTCFWKSKMTRYCSGLHPFCLCFFLHFVVFSDTACLERDQSKNQKCSVFPKMSALKQAKTAKVALQMDGLWLKLLILYYFGVCWNKNQKNKSKMYVSESQMRNCIFTFCEVHPLSLVLMGTGWPSLNSKLVCIFFQPCLKKKASC